MRPTFTTEQRNGAALAGGMFLQWGVLSVCFLALAAHSYLWVAITDTATAFLGFTILKQVQQAETNFEKFCYVAGGVLGSQVGMLLATTFLK